MRQKRRGIGFETVAGVGGAIVETYFAGHFLAVFFCLLSLLFFLRARVPDLIWFDSVYFVATAGFIADQLMRDKQQRQQQQILV